MTDSPVAANIMVLQDWPTAWQQARSRRLRWALRSSPGGGSTCGLSPDWGLSASIFLFLPNRSREAARCRREREAFGVHPAKSPPDQGSEGRFLLLSPAWQP